MTSCNYYLKKLNPNDTTDIEDAKSKLKFFLDHGSSEEGNTIEPITMKSMITDKAVSPNKSSPEQIENKTSKRKKRSKSKRHVEKEKRHKKKKVVLSESSSHSSDDSTDKISSPKKTRLAAEVLRVNEGEQMLNKKARELPKIIEIQNITNFDMARSQISSPLSFTNNISTMPTSSKNNLGESSTPLTSRTTTDDSEGSRTSSILIPAKKNSGESNTSSPLIRSITGMPKPQNTIYQEQVLRYLDRIQTTIDENQILIHQLIRSEENMGIAEKPEGMNFPVSSLVAFDEMENVLKTSERHYSYLKTRLSCIGGTNERQCVIYMMRFLLINELAMRFNWAGREKKCFKETAMMKIINEAAAATFKSQHSDQAVAGAVKDWLKQAKNRHLHHLGKHRI